MVGLPSLQLLELIDRVKTVLTHCLITNFFGKFQDIAKSDDHTRASGFVAKSEDGEERLSFNLNGRFINISSEELRFCMRLDSIQTSE